MVTKNSHYCGYFLIEKVVQKGYKKSVPKKVQKWSKQGYEEVWSFVHLSGGKFTESSIIGTFTEMVLHAIMRLGFSFKEIELAIEEMCKNQHNVAHFGMNRTLIYTLDSIKESDKNKIV